MDSPSIPDLFSLHGKVVVVTGGAGILGSAICSFLASSGMKVAILDLNHTMASSLEKEIVSHNGDAIAVECNVLSKESLVIALEKVIKRFQHVDVLINGAGGNKAQATTGVEQTFFDLPLQAIQSVVDLNLVGTILTSQVFGKFMADQKSGVILNISSMNFLRPLTRIPAYSAAKAGVTNFTQWLAVHMAREYSTAIRVNAIAPGFFQTEQNRFLLTEKETGDLTLRGRAIIDHTPMNRFGIPEDLFGTIAWLLSPASSFITGIVVPVDGGFSAYSGV